MKKHASVVVALLAALLVFAATAQAADVAKYRYDGVTYTPATDATHTSPAGFVPTVVLKPGVHYYASKPPFQAVQVYARNLQYVVWVDLSSAVDAHWYVGHDDGLPTWAIVVILVGGTLITGIGLGFLLDRRRQRAA